MKQHRSRIVRVCAPLAVQRHAQRRQPLSLSLARSWRCLARPGRSIEIEARRERHESRANPLLRHRCLRSRRCCLRGCEPRCVESFICADVLVSVVHGFGGDRANAPAADAAVQAARAQPGSRALFVPRSLQDARRHDAARRDGVPAREDGVPGAVRALSATTQPELTRLRSARSLLRIVAVDRRLRCRK